MNATANVPGDLVYMPPAGTVLKAGVGQTLSVTFTPTDTANYTATTAMVSLNVMKAGLTVSGVTAANKVYDGTTVATMNTSGATLNGLLSIDTGSVSLIGTGTGSFTDRNVGTGKLVTITGLSITGTDAGNYTFNTTAATTAATLPTSTPV